MKYIPACAVAAFIWVALPPEGKADPPVDIRTRWLNTSYDLTVEHLEGKKWVERSNSTQKITATLTETNRTAEYVELSGFNFGIGRLTASRAEMKKGGKWEWVSNGRWERSPAVGTPPPKALTPQPGTERVKNSSSIHSTGPTAEEVARIPLRSLELEPPMPLQLLMQSAEQERAYQIAYCKKTIRDVLDKANVSATTVSSIVGASNGTNSIVAVAKSKGVKLDLQQLGSLQHSEQLLRDLQSQVFVRPVLRDLVPNRAGVIPNATVVHVYDRFDDSSPASTRQVLVQLPSEAFLLINAFPAELVAVGKPLPNVNASYPDTFYKSIKYTDVEYSGAKRSVLLVDVIDVSSLPEYLKSLGLARDNANNPQVRTWTKQDGKTVFRGIFETFTNDRVAIRKIDGTIENISLLELSQIDQDFVKTALKERRSQGKTNRKK